jgi:hypothetical protein
MFSAPPSLFKPAIGLGNPHVQTLWGPLWRKAPPLPHQRERLWLADGDFLDLDWHGPHTATAPLVVVMGADDLMLPNFLQVAVDALARFPAAAVVQCGVAVIDEHGRLVRPLGDRVKQRYAPRADEAVLLAGEQLAGSLLRANWTYFPSLAWRTDTVRRIGFRQGLHVTQDLALILDTARDGGGLVVDPALAFLYRRHSGSDSSVKALDGRRFDEERELFAAEAADLARRGWPRAARAARRHVTSRLNALVLLPVAVRAGDRAALGKLVRHIVG